MVNGKPVYDIGGGKSDFGGVVRQMMPAYMDDGCNNVERLIANMDFAQVNGAVVTQEYIDGNESFNTVTTIIHISRHHLTDGSAKITFSASDIIYRFAVYHAMLLVP